MTDLQWAPGFDNEAGYVDIITNKAGQSTAMVQPIRYPDYVRAADGSMKAKGSPRTTITIENVSFADYTTIRETNLGFSADESDVSKEITVSLPEPDQVTFNDWNVILTHRPGVDTELDITGSFYARTTWDIIIIEAT